MISVITPSVRKEMLEIVKKSLNRQTYKDFEWIVVSPFYYSEAICYIEPKKRKVDYYNLNKAWNKGFQNTKGELIVSIQDGIWFPPDTLQKLWDHYQANPKLIVGAVGNQYDQIENGKPEHVVYQDSRMRSDFGSFYEVESTDIEWTLCSFPRKAIFEVGGMDEKYDQGAAMSEKEANLRMQQAGYLCYLDQSIEYRAIHHPRLSKEWDEKYKIACEMYKKDVHEILNERRLKLKYL